jgi:hypothetical protein
MNRRLSGKKLMDNASFFSTHRRPLLLAAAWTLLLALLFLWTEVRETGGVISLPLDDAWIHFQYARNLSQGHGFSYNPGQPTPGSTAPLWTVLLGVFGFFGSSPEWFTLASLLLSFSFLLLTVFLSYGLTFELTGARLPAFLAAIGVATTGRLLWAGLAGMETTAFAAVSLAAVALSLDGAAIGSGQPASPGGARPVCPGCSRQPVDMVAGAETNETSPFAAGSSPGANINIGWAGLWPGGGSLRCL